ARTQPAAGLALDPVGVRDDAVQAAVGRDPLRRGLRTDARDADQVVARLADQRGEITVLARANAIARLDRLRRHARQLRDAADRVQHRHMLADELERIAVARA